MPSQEFIRINHENLLNPDHKSIRLQRKADPLNPRFRTTLPPNKAGPHGQCTDDYSSAAAALRTRRDRDILAQGSHKGT